MEFDTKTFTQKRKEKVSQRANLLESATRNAEVMQGRWKKHGKSTGERHDRFGAVGRRVRDDVLGLGRGGWLHGVCDAVGVGCDLSVSLQRCRVSLDGERRGGPS
jgi:hypothetical protein